MTICQRRFSQEPDIALVCDSQLEFDAVYQVMHELWDAKDNACERAPRYCNSCLTGRIGDCNIVVASIESTTNSATVAENLRSSYPGIQWAILVRTCDKGSLTHREQVRPDDLIISYRSDYYGFLSKIALEHSAGSAPLVVRLLASLDTDAKTRELNDIKKAPTKQSTCPRTATPEQENDDISASELPAIAIHFGGVHIHKQRVQISRGDDLVGAGLEGLEPWLRFPCVIVSGVLSDTKSEEAGAWRDSPAAKAAATSKAILKLFIHAKQPAKHSVSTLPTAHEEDCEHPQYTDSSDTITQGSRMDIISSQSGSSHIQSGSTFSGNVRAKSVSQGNVMVIS
ncbi:hypothetical protein FSARC_2957 [Fusarium sarcochroum]|uniref:Uncharacterized protein n=1 Tax=Fusarium sarcochroum TaxID=1208366 RepID=A0A8H4U4S7_9HYPO|nr:hypothetical protein FSARC_2957 [Fusarium sarcochroum]